MPKAMTPESKPETTDEATRNPAEIDDEALDDVAGGAKKISGSVGRGGLTH